MIVWGGEPSSSLSVGGMYDPSLNSWTPMSTVDAPYSEGGITAVWTGTEMIVYGGHTTETRAGGTYYPQRDSWRPISPSGGPFRAHDQVAAWTGDMMLVWGGKAGGDKTNAGWVYDPARDPGYYYLYAKPQ